MLSVDAILGKDCFLGQLGLQQSNSIKWSKRQDHMSVEDVPINLNI